MATGKAQLPRGGTRIGKCRLLTSDQFVFPNKTSLRCISEIGRTTSHSRVLVTPGWELGIGLPVIVGDSQNCGKCPGGSKGLITLALNVADFVSLSASRLEKRTDREDVESQTLLRSEITVVFTGQLSGGAIMGSAVEMGVLWLRGWGSIACRRCGVWVDGVDGCCGSLLQTCGLRSSPSGHARLLEGVTRAEVSSTPHGAFLRKASWKASAKQIKAAGWTWLRTSISTRNVAGRYETARRRYAAAMRLFMSEVRYRSVGPLRTAAELGYDEAMVRFGALLQGGCGIAKNSRGAVEWFCKAIAKGNASGKAALANCLQHGHGCDRDVDAAVRLVRESAEAGSALGMEAWGWRILFDAESTLGAEDGSLWVRKSAATGEPCALNTLAIQFQVGQGMHRNAKRAVSWVRKAAQLGDTSAMMNCARWTGEEESRRWWAIATQNGRQGCAEECEKMWGSRSRPASLATDM